MADGSTDVSSQSVPWGLTVDAEFGGCKCADDGAEFTLDVDFNNRSRWSCKCESTDNYASQPEAIMVTDPDSGKLVLNDRNGKKCGIIAECQNAAVNQQTTRWNQEAARALKTKNSA